jgi:hypothetical protein
MHAAACKDMQASLLLLLQLWWCWCWFWCCWCYSVETAASPTLCCVLAPVHRAQPVLASTCKGSAPVVFVQPVSLHSGVNTNVGTVTGTFAAMLWSHALQQQHPAHVALQPCNVLLLSKQAAHKPCSLQVWNVNAQLPQLCAYRTCASFLYGVYDSINVEVAL